MYKIRILTIIMAALFFLCPVEAQAHTYVDCETPIEIQIAANKYGKQYNIAPELIEAICYRESRYQEDACNGSCKGLMQINESFHKTRMQELEISDIFDIDSNIHVGSDYLAELFDEYEDVGVVLAAYHGEKKGIENAKNGKLSKYTQAILEKSEELERLHGK